MSYFVRSFVAAWLVLGKGQPCPFTPFSVFRVGVCGSVSAYTFSPVFGVFGRGVLYKCVRERLMCCTCCTSMCYAKCRLEGSVFACVGCVRGLVRWIAARCICAWGTTAHLLRGCTCVWSWWTAVGTRGGVQKPRQQQRHCTAWLLPAPPLTKEPLRHASTCQHHVGGWMLVGRRQCMMDYSLPGVYSSNAPRSYPPPLQAVLQWQHQNCWPVLVEPHHWWA